MDTKRYSALIESFYAASMEPELWPGVATQVADFFDSASTSIQLRTDPTKVGLRVTTANYGAAAQRIYAAHFHKLDPYVNGWLKIGRPGIFAGCGLVDPHVLRDSEAYRDYLRNIGVYHFLGAAVNLGSGRKLFLGIHRPIELADFSAEHRQQLELVLPHLTRAMDMHAVLAAAEGQRRLACDMFEALSLASSWSMPIARLCSQILLPIAYLLRGMG